MENENYVFYQIYMNDKMIGTVVKIGNEWFGAFVISKVDQCTLTMRVKTKEEIMDFLKQKISDSNASETIFTECPVEFHSHDVERKYD